MEAAGVPSVRARGAPAVQQQALANFVLVGVALGLGALGDALLRATPWGMNVVLWVAALTVAPVALLRWRAFPLRADGAALLATTLAFAACLALRDSGTLRFLNGLAVVATLALGLAALRAWPGQLRVASLGDYALTVGYAAVHAFAGSAPLLFREVAWRRVPLGRWSGPAVAVARGVFIAAPLLLLFGGLFVAADATFERLVSRALGFDLGALPSHLTVAAVYAWLSAGLLRSTLLDGERATPLARTARAPLVGVVEMATVLGLLNLLFLAFVVVQLRYFFGGAGTVLATDGLTYAQYARRGFFELTAVTALVLPVVLVAHSSVRRHSARDERIYRWLAGLLVALLYVVMASALQRMLLYQRLFGLTELRLYTTACMGWFGIVFSWFLATVLRGRPRHFAIGALVSALAVVAALDAISPDALIVRTNAARVAQGQSSAFDDLYAASLSADAVPSLVRVLPALPPDQQGPLAWRVLHSWAPPSQPDWRTWNWGRQRAWDAVAQHESMLAAVATHPANARRSAD
jgi:hypothetical protein